MKNISVVEWYRWRDLTKDRTFNSAGAFTDEQECSFFMITKPTITNKIILNCIGMKKISTNWNTNFALHYTKGKGFYENYKEDGFSVYGLTRLEGQRLID
jgi:iron complex outermembrane receptor protein